ncbi:MarR family winged helix-turn-helix transcriptional regulator [Pseudomonas brassicacearum]|jgi:Transcriptional regulators|uniref:Winged helix-turn-helix transcriptional regulator n=1 Tax=Pseudomonas palleroniana TaxID=191390 RepID=A0A6H9RZL4_9PSED|nr:MULTISPECIES: MarR family winged helix-turn-helix transcriptional regulator [Pseudomonas]EIK70335.1 transcriptional regulator, MarR family [Pseudomonas fluorescens Q8r1-96]KAB0525438.1 winged helix-turn-helix transcriptional regulator [Pseudomonas brassicacearum subsp. brassicacearum]KAB0561105.1 winged helix-turn-helix transcriptional regulator [Pseudomonas palleroniana]NJP64397.1 winged helix-turn-helix transcriptional regulator [Pseudomonas brassicacearum]QEO76918.1 MarR family transcrip
MSSSEPDTWFRFVRAHRCLIREIERRLAAAGLPAYAWYDALWGLESGPDGTRRMNELADVMAIERYNLTRLVDRLEAEGLVTRSRASDDGRGAYAAITERGKVLRKKMWNIYEGAVEELFLSQFDDAQQRVFSDALERAASAARNSGRAR